MWERDRIGDNVGECGKVVYFKHGKIAHREPPSKLPNLPLVLRLSV